MRVVDANVFDPALSGPDSEREPVRLEMMVTDWDNEHHSYIDTTKGAIVVHYGRLMKIYLDDEQEDVEDPVGLAADFNQMNIFNEPVVPVTVTKDGGFWQVYYMRLGLVNKIMRDSVNAVDDISGHPDGGEWEWLPDPTYCRENKVSYYLQHSHHVSVRLFRDLIEEFDDCVEDIDEVLIKDLIKKPAKPREMYPHRLIDMTDEEWANHNRAMYHQRTSRPNN